MEDGQTLSEARRPRSLVAKLRCSGKSTAMTGDATCGVDLLRWKHSHGDGRRQGHRGGIARFERAIVRARDCDARRRGDASRDLSLILRVFFVLLGSSATHHETGKENHTDQKTCEDPHG